MMLRHIDKFLNRITMYRLMLYLLVFIWFFALILSSFKVIDVLPLSLLYSSFIIFSISGLANLTFSRLLKIPTNIESWIISALIFSLIISPPESYEFVSILPFLIITPFIGIASKFLIAPFRKHLANPVALALVLTFFILGKTATWWVGTIYLLPIILIGGVLVIRKIRRWDLMLSFFVIALFSLFINAFTGPEPFRAFYIYLFESPLVFFAFIMLSEPITMPPTRKKRVIYGGVVGLLYKPFFPLPFVITPEIALVFGNLISFFMSPMRRYVLRLIESKKIASNTGEFTFKSDKPIRFIPGQYMEWTLNPYKIDARGNRRFFTIASSPTEDIIKLGVKFSPKSSAFKTKLATYDFADKIYAGQVAGDFVLPSNTDEKLVFVAGGIGITPFRSMIKYMLDTEQKRDITLFYSTNTIGEIAYAELLDDAEKNMDLKIVCTLTDESQLPEQWNGYVGFINGEMILNEVSDYLDRTYYISGPDPMVRSTEKILLQMGISDKQIKKDYFPGF